jgi:sodium pump decarboxylase gamma subunit
MDLINNLKDPATLELMSAGDKILGGIMVSVIGMTITVLCLALLWGAIAVMTKVLVKKPKTQPVVVVPNAAPVQVAIIEETEEDEDLIAVITAAIAASLNTSIHNIVVQNIVRVPDDTPAWAKSGRIEQMNARF